MRDYLRLGLKLFVIALVGGLALGGTNAITKDRIEEQNRAEAIAARSQVLPSAAVFEQITIAPEGEYASIQEAYAGLGQDGAKAGVTIKLETGGFGGSMELTVGVGPDGAITGVRVGTHSETPGLGAKAQDDAFTDQYKAKLAPLTVVKGDSGESEISAITGATITSDAVTNAANLAARFAVETGRLEEHRLQAGSKHPPAAADTLCAKEGKDRLQPTKTPALFCKEGGPAGPGVFPARRRCMFTEEVSNPNGQRKAKAYKRILQRHHRGEPDIPTRSGHVPDARGYDGGLERHRHGAGGDVRARRLEFRHFAPA